MMRIKRKQISSESKLARFLERHGVPYVWEGTWPAIPRARRFDEPIPRRQSVKVSLSVVCALPSGELQRKEVVQEVPPDAPPVWVENIYHRLFEKILPLNKAMSLEFYDAAIYGYAYTAISRELATRARSLPDTVDREIYEAMRPMYEKTLNACRRRVTDVLTEWKLLEAADYLKGFSYGMERQHLEEGWTPSATTQVLQIYKVLLRSQDHIENLIRQGKTSKDLADYVAAHAVLENFKINHAGCYCRTVEGKAKYLKTFQKLCERISLPLPSPGRPSRGQKLRHRKI